MVRIAYHRDPYKIIWGDINNSPTRQVRAVNLALKTSIGEVSSRGVVSMGPRRTQGSHHFNRAIHELMKIETVTLVSAWQIERRDEEPRRSKSLSLRIPILINK